MKTRSRRTLWCRDPIGTAGCHTPEPVPVSLTALIREVDDDGDVEKLIEQTHTKTGLARDRLQELVENSFRDAQQIAEQFT